MVCYVSENILFHQFSGKTRRRLPGTDVRDFFCFLSDVRILLSTIYRKDCSANSIGNDLVGGAINVFSV